MRSPHQYGWAIGCALTALVVVTAVLFDAFLVPALAGPGQAEPAVVAASLHNPGFDNHDWYEFNDRYQSAYPAGSWLPDDDGNTSNTIPPSTIQDWRLWFLDGRAIVETDPEAVYAHSVEGVQIRPYSGGSQLAGLYQVVYNTTPCLTYDFGMYAQSRPEQGDDSLTALQVGIDRTGWHPPSGTDPAVHGTFPASTVWGTAKKYQWSYGPLSVSAEAWGTKIAVYTYADAGGGRSHRILWDTGSLAVSPYLHNPGSLPAGTLTPSVITGTTTVTVSWTTTNAAIDQVLYRLLPPAAPSYPNKIYLPIVARSGGSTDWQKTSIHTAASTSHQVVINGLQADSDYAYVVLSKAFISGQCTLWVSSQGTFHTQP